MAERYGWRVAAEEIVFLPGVEPGFNMALAALLRPGEGVVVQTPAYSPILAAPSHWGLRRLDVALQPNGAGGFATDMDALGAALAEAGALLFCHPHNPTGKTFTRPELEAIAAACLRHDAWIISDEIHCDLLFDARRHVPMASLAPEVAARTVTLMSASKSFNVAGLKTAFAIVQDAELRARFSAAQHGLVDSVNVMGLEATLAALTRGEPWRQALITYLQANRDWLVEAVRRDLPGIRMHRPEATFLAWLDCGDVDLGGLEPQAFFLQRARVGLSAGSEFGAAWRGFARLNFGCPRRTLEEGIARMAASLARG
jgi:cystathionine beta-lyase